MLDEDLRSELATWARTARRLPVPTIPELRTRARRRRVRLTAAVALAAATVTAIALVVTLAPVGLGLGGHPATGHPATGRPAHHQRDAPKPRAWYPAGPLPSADAGPAAAPYYVSIRFQQAPVDAVVVNWATGKTVAVVTPPATSGQGGSRPSRRPMTTARSCSRLPVVLAA